MADDTRRRIGDIMGLFKHTIAEKAVEAICREISRFDETPIPVSSDNVLTNVEGHELRVAIADLLLIMSKTRMEKKDG